VLRPSPGHVTNSVKERRRELMLCDSTRTLLQTILQSLQAPDQAGWDDQIESGNQCLYEMHQMTRLSYRAYKTIGSDNWQIPDGSGMNRAMPHVKAMMSAIRRRDRATALENGKAALAEMNGMGHTRASGTAKDPRTENRESSNGVRQHEKPTGEHRPLVEGRSSSRRCRAASGK